MLSLKVIFSCTFSLQTLTKFEAAKTRSGEGFLRLTAVRPLIGCYLPAKIQNWKQGVMDFTERQQFTAEESICNFFWEISQKFDTFVAKLSKIAKKLTTSAEAFHASPAPASNAGMLTLRGFTWPGRDQSQMRTPRALNITADCTALFITKILSSVLPQTL